MLPIFSILLGWYVADFLSGLMHYFLDNCTFAAHWPFIGPLHRDFISHHDNPTVPFGGHILSNLGKALVTTLPLWPLVYFVPWFAIPLILGITLSPYTHTLSHQGGPPILLQRLGLFISPGEHQKHHLDHTRHYCILNGWSNPLLNCLLDLVSCKENLW